MTLNSKQQAAVEYLEGPLIVIAGPGTGKTQLLSAKVAHILKHTDANPHNILCLTFTEAGAVNMRTRLTSMIGRAANEVNIHTYHAFGSDLLSAYKNYSTDYNRELNQAIDEVTQHKIIRQIQAQLPAMDVLKKARIKDIIDTIKEAKSARLTAQSLAKIAAANLKENDIIKETITPYLNRYVKNMKFKLALEQIYQPILNELANLAKSETIVEHIEPQANFLLRELAQIIEQETLAEKPSVKPLTDWKNRHFENSDPSHFRLKNFIANKKLASLAKIMSEYDQYLQTNELFDFADMIEESIKILKSDRGFCATLQENYQYIMLDEFQDTNRSQFELIHLLSDYEKPTIMAVCDDDQAIFAFQGANVSNVLDFEQTYQAEIITLTDNYRSTSEILNFSRHIANQIDDSFAKTHHINKSLTSINNQQILKSAENSSAIFCTEEVKNTPNSSSLILRHEFLSADDEYAWIASQIQKLIAAGKSQSDIAILTPKHKYVAPLLPYLKAYPEINVSYEKRENILEDTKITQLTTTARFIFDLSQGKHAAHQLPDILRYPFWQLNHHQIISILTSAHNDKRNTLDYLAESDNPKFTELANFFAQLAVICQDIPLELFLDYLIGTAPLPDSDFRSPFLDYYTTQETSPSTISLYENLSILRNRLHDHLRLDNPKLKDFIAFLDDYEAADATILNSSPYQDSADSVQVMTAFSAKGLEFKHVFLVAVDNLAWGGAKGNNNLLTLPVNLVSIRHTGTTKNEQLRLLFVAITRAKQSLILTNSAQDFSGKTPQRLAFLDERESDGFVLSPFIPNQTVIKHQNLDLKTRQSNLKTHWISAYQTIEPNLKSIFSQKISKYRLTATDLTSFIDISYSGPLQFYCEKILSLPQPPADEKLQLGNLMHATFEVITKQNLSDTAALEFLNQKIKQIPTTDQVKQSLTEQGTASLTASLQAFSKILRHPDAKAEVNFSHQHLALDSTPITGKIDHIHIDKKAKTIEIYDFKTGKYHKENWPSHPTLYKYAMQLGFYKLLLNLSPEYRDFKVTKGHILFIYPDPADFKVYDKVYEFDQSTEAHLKTLIKSVYSHIKSLDFFATDSPLAVQSDADTNLKDLKNFVELVIKTAPKLDS